MMETLSLGMEATKYFPKHIEPWMNWMSIILLFLALVFAIRFRGARWMVLAQAIVIPGGFLVFWLQDHTFTKLLGIVHLVWLVPLYFFARDVLSDRWIVYRIYAGLAVATIVISLVFDAKDVAEYVMGDTGSILVGVPENSALKR